MAGARALWVATGMKQEQFGKPIIAIVNSFTQFVPGHTHLHEIGQIVREEIEKMGCYAAEFNTIAIDDGIAMGHDGMLYSLPSRDIIADSVEYMVNAHKADAMICISNCDKVTPGMLMASMRLNIPTVFCSGGPMEAGRWRGENADLITAMVKGADPSVSDEEMREIEATVAAWQRNDSCHTYQPHRTLPSGCPPDCEECVGLLRGWRRERTATQYCHPSGFPQRHDARHRHGWFYEYRAPPAGCSAGGWC